VRAAVAAGAGYRGRGRGLSWPWVRAIVVGPSTFSDFAILLTGAKLPRRMYTPILGSCTPEFPIVILNR
jgi:hypothetical protein